MPRPRGLTARPAHHTHPRPTTSSVPRTLSCNGQEKSEMNFTRPKRSACGARAKRSAENVELPVAAITTPRRPARAQSFVADAKRSATTENCGVAACTNLHCGR